MRFHKLDLNLLVALDALLTEQSVSKAAERLHLTQPAISNALARLRDHFGDPLLVQLGRRMHRTPLAERLREPLRDLFIQLQTIAHARPIFDPASEVRTLTIVASDFVVSVYLAEVFRKIARLAPGISLSMRSMGNRNYEMFDQGKADLMIIPEFACNNSHPRQLLFTDDLVCLAWKENELVDERLTPDQYMTTPQVLPVFGETPGEGDRTSMLVNAILESQGYSPRVVATMPSWSMTMEFIVGTKHICTVPRRLAKLGVSRMPLKYVPLPISMPPLVEVVQWHRLQDRDPVNVWLRNVLYDVAGEMAGAAA